MTRVGRVKVNTEKNPVAVRPIFFSVAKPKERADTRARGARRAHALASA